MKTNSNSIKVDHLASSKVPQSELDISEGLSQQDLESLRKADPFMYYSIPEVRRAAIMLEQKIEVLPTRLQRESAAPVALDTSTNVTPEAEQQKRQMIRRCSSISYEAHPDVMLEDLLEDLAEDSLEDVDLFEVLAGCAL